MDIKEDLASDGLEVLSKSKNHSILISMLTINVIVVKTFGNAINGLLIDSSRAWYNKVQARCDALRNNPHLGVVKS